MNQIVLTNRIKLMSNLLVWVIFAIIAVFLLTPNKYYSGGVESDAIPASVSSVVVKSPFVLSEVQLTAHDNSNFTIESLRNRWSFLFFGYTQCPDICPATMHQLVRIKQAMQTQNIQHNNLQFVFISVDPQRDTPDHLASYVNYFDESFIAATGDIENIKHIEKQLGVFHRYSKPDTDGAYRVDHSTNVYLIDPKARVSAKFQVPMDTNHVARQYAGIQELFKRNVL